MKNKFHILDRYRDYDSPVKIVFEGGPLANLFTREISASLEGALAKNYRYDEENIGFVSASVDGRPCHDHCWTRDAGVFLRELTEYGYLGRAAWVAERLIDLCGRNEEGFFAFPQQFFEGVRSSGYEIDGTGAILISFALLCSRLNEQGSSPALAFSEYLSDYAAAPGSPLRFLMAKAEKDGLVAGEGEFGGGLYIPGFWCNIVQNTLVSCVFRIWADYFKNHGNNPALAGKLSELHGKIEENIGKYLVGGGRLVWCVDRETKRPAEEIVNAPSNRGFAGINGAGAMVCDVAGFDGTEWKYAGAAQNTFMGLLGSVNRKYLYEKYGMYLQFDGLLYGLLTSPSYGQGYALQWALISDQPHIAGRLLEYLVKYTHSPPPAYLLTRDNPYWFYERMLADEYFMLPAELQNCGEGCGALNLVNVAEPLKCARLIAGLYGGKQGKPRLVGDITGVKILPQ